MYVCSRNAYRGQLLRRARPSRALHFAERQENVKRGCIKLAALWLFPRNATFLRCQLKRGAALRRCEVCQQLELFDIRRRGFIGVGTTTDHGPD
jgi:hypothetical protein